MKTSTILDAMDCLDQARHALHSGALSIEQQIALGSRCTRVAYELRMALEQECPEIKLETQS